MTKKKKSTKQQNFDDRTPYRNQQNSDNIITEKPTRWHDINNLKMHININENK
jgi:hypothetical protein